LKYYGHEAVAVLDGNLPLWLIEDRHLEAGEKRNLRGDFYGEPRKEMVVSTAGVKAMLGDKNFLLVDSRSPERYRGEVEPIDPVAGRIPGSINRFYENNIQPSGLLFKSPEILRDEFEALLGGVKPQNAVFYCGSGPTSCHNLLAMVHAGLPMPRDYAGSWSEWIRDPANPVEKG